MTSIGPQTKLSKALALHPDVLPYIVSLNPHDFDRLNNPLMRKLMPPRITLARLAHMVDKPVDELINGIYSAAHIEETAAKSSENKQDFLPVNPAQAPDWISNEIVEVIDLLASDERLDTDPFVPIFPALKRAKVGDVPLLKHKWEPQPLYDVWKKLEIEHLPVTPIQLAGLFHLIQNETINKKMAKEIFAGMVESGRNAEEIVREKGFLQIRDEGEVGRIIEEILQRNPKEVSRFQHGEAKLLGYFIGEVMKKTEGKANPKIVNEILKKKLE